MTTHGNSRRSVFRLAGTLLAIAGLAVSAVACAPSGGGGDGGSTTNPTSTTDPGKPTAGGSLTVLLDSGFAGGWATGLDPATSNTTGANLPQNSAIFGGLFVLAPKGNTGEIVPNQAESYSWSSDELTLTIKLRKGITFTDGTPLNAEAVVWNWIRQLHSGSTGTPRIEIDKTVPMPKLSDAFMESIWSALPKDVNKAAVEADLGAIQAVDDSTVTLKLSAVNGSLINGFPAASLNLIASPTAYAKAGGQAFSQTPVGAGPFVIKSNKTSERLELTKNPNYFKAGQPYLDSLTFQSVAGDQVEYQTLLAGQGDVIEGMSSVPLIAEAQNNPDLNVVLGVPTSPYVIQLNTRTAPFNNIKAREAIYYATDFAAINKGLFKDQGEMSQSFTASGGLFHNPNVPGYRTYDLAKAKALVQEIGGLKVTLGTVDVVTARSVTTALQTQWKEAGIDVTISAQPLGDVISAFIGGKWESLLQTAGAWDPSVGIGVAVRFGSTSPFSGTPLPDGATSAQDAIAKGLTTQLDKLLLEAVATNDAAARTKKYDEIAKYISDQAYAPFGMAFSPAQVMRKGVHGPGLDQPIPALAVNQGVLYDSVWVESK